MAYDFDRVVDRHGTRSLKYDFAKARGRSEELLPLWVADMDFPTAPEINQALADMVSHGIYGYSESTENYFEAIQNWYERRFSWRPEAEWIVKTPGVVYAIAAAVRSLTEEGDSVLIQSPVYYPFREVIWDNHRNLITNPLVQDEEGRYRMDFEDLEKKLRENRVKLLILCSPHNPVGRVWRRDELLRLGELAVRYEVTVVSDEIHSDFVYPGHTHTVFASLSPELAERSIICTAPTKTFNLAGLQISNIIIPNPELRGAVLREIARTGYSQVGLPGLVAAEAAYRQGEKWLEELLIYLKDNVDYLKGRIEREIPEVKVIEPEGTYLLWLDFRMLHLDRKGLDRFVEDEAGLWLDSGAIFGPEGTGFQRINIACPRKTLEQALDQLITAVKNRIREAERCCG